MPKATGVAQSFGDLWTKEKLDIIEAYLDAYTTALKNQRFRLIYVDAFAGTGAIQIGPEDDRESFLEGSVWRALKVTDRPFDSLLFVEKDAEKARALTAATAEHAKRVSIVNEDANVELPRFCKEMDTYDRAVVFLDPFALQVDWATVETLAKTRNCDVWILFPVGAIRRMLPRAGQPRPQWQEHLNRVFGDESWRSLYRTSGQQRMFGEPPIEESESGVEQIVENYRARLQTVFVKVAPARRTLRNSKKTALFEFMFAAGNPRGASLAVRIADHILTKI